MTEFGTTLPTSPGLCPCGGGLKSHVAHQQPAEICQVSDAYSSTCLPPVTVPAQSLPCQRCHLSPYLRSHCPVSAATSPADVIPCHVSPIDWSSCLPYATSPATCRLPGLPRHPYGLYSQHATWHCTDCTVIPPPFFFTVWVFGQNAMSFAYGARLTKQIYGRNQEDETDAMALVSSDSGHFHF
jgi:hypothetical protein